MSKADIKADMLGEGKDRKVFQHKNPSLVYKIEKTKGVNKQEYQNYLKIKKLGLEKWVAPCWLACDVLVMLKCQPLNKMPELIPDIFVDCKKDNWGTLNGHACLMDYSELRESTHKRMVRPCT